MLLHGARAPQVIKRDQLGLMKPQAVLVDVAIDQGGCFETSRPTTHRDPTFEVDGIIHYCVTNMPGAVPITSTYALTNATLPYVLALADHGVAEAARRDPGLRLGINVAAGQGHPPGGRRGGGHGVRAPRGGARDRGCPSRPYDRRSEDHCEVTDPEEHMATATVTKHKNFIDGEFVDPAEGETEEVSNPATGEAIAEAPLSTEEDVDRAVAAAQQGLRRAGRRTTPGERSLALLKLADAIEEHADELADLESADAGKPRKAFLEDEIPFMVDNLRFFAGAARNLEGAPPASTWRATPRSSAASRWAWSARSRRGTTR